MFSNRRKAQKAFIWGQNELVGFVKIVRSGAIIQGYDFPGLKNFLSIPTKIYLSTAPAGKKL